jgi:putative ABC transport system permease protein
MKGNCLLRFTRKVLSSFTDEETLSSIMDDLSYRYDSLKEEKGTPAAVSRHCALFLILLFPFLLQSIFGGFAMLKNYLKIAFRNLKRHKAYSFVNIVGLSIGIASCILLLSYMHYELSFDKSHDKADRIYRVVAQGEMAGEAYSNAKIPASMTSILLSDYPEIENVVRFASDIFDMFRYKDIKFFEPHFLYADNSVFQVFSYSFIRGDMQTALKVPNTIVLTQETARKFFGEEDPMGKVIRFNDKADLTVTGIMQKPHSNSHLQFNMLISFETFLKYRSWAAQSKTVFSSYTYLLLKEGVTIENFKVKLTDFLDRHIGEQFKPMGGKLTCRLQPLTSIHLHSRLLNDTPGNTSVYYVYTFSVIAALILLVACINYINLSTARSSARAKEVGMRKVLGGLRGQIVRQFVGESLLYGIIAFLLGMLMVIAALPAFRDLTGQSISMSFLSRPMFYAEGFTILLFVWIVSGWYPAIILSRFRPVKILKGLYFKGSRSSRLRNTLVIFQFSILVSLIVMTVGIFSQLHYIRHKNLGFHKEQLVYMKFHNDQSDNDNRIIRMNSIKEELSALNAVVAATLSSHVPGTKYYQGQYVPEGYPENQSFTMEEYAVDDVFFNALEIGIVEGRGFKKEMMSDAENSVIINETAAKSLGWKNSLGKQIMEYGNKNYTIIGVAKDFHSRSLHHAIEPMIFKNLADFHTLTLRIKSENIPYTLKLIGEIWDKFEPEHPFEYFFLDDTIDALYKTEIRMGKAIQVFTYLAICIGCLGLFGLVSFLTEQQTKEIGIRKVLGASESSIVFLLSKQSTKWVLISNIFSWPTAYFIMNEWLKSFAYRINISIWVFVLSGMLAVGIALITVSYQAFRAAWANPVDSLRYE